MTGQRALSPLFSCVDVPALRRQMGNIPLRWELFPRAMPRIIQFAPNHSM